MKKDFKIDSAAFVVIASLGLTACEGGDNTFSGNYGNTSIYPVSHTLDGGWIMCTNNPNGSESARQILDINGSSLTHYIYRFETPNCLGTLIDTRKLTATIEYPGEQVTAICIAEKTNTKYKTLAVDGKIQDANQLATFLQQSGVSSPDHDISCIYKNELFSGARNSNLDGSSDAKRPRAMELTQSGIRL